MVSIKKVFATLISIVVFVSTFSFGYAGTAQASIATIDIEPSSYYNTYWNDFEERIWDNKAIGTKVIAEGGANSASLTLDVENEASKYMRVDVTGSGQYRVSKLELPSEALSGAEVIFDWKPISAQDSSSRFGDIAFLSSGSSYPYFGLQFNKAREISYYTIGENISSGWGVTYSEETLEGGSVRNTSSESGTATSTGITADGETWYTVKISFDYDQHLADLAIVEKSNPTHILYEAKNIPIYASAMNTAVVAVGGWKGIISMGIDNLGVRYEYAAANSIASIEQPENVMVTASEWERHVSSCPTKVKATMGDGSIQEFNIGAWASTPEFKEDVSGTYTWDAPLILPEGILNPKNLTLTYKVNFGQSYFVTGAYDPTAMELKYGSITTIDELMNVLPRQTDAVLNNGKVVKMDIDPSSWTATYTTHQDLGKYLPKQFDSPEFNPQQEGIYVYKAKLKSTDSYEVNKDIWVECRVNYFAYKNNFNGFERSIENLDRGLYVIKNKVFDSTTKTYVDGSQGGNFLSWRILVDEYAKVSQGKDISFDIYRNGSKIGAVKNLTNYLDVDGEVGDKYIIKTTQNNVESFSKEVKALADNYISIQLQRPLPMYSQTGNFGMYRLNDTEVGDVDGDGVYEIIVKWYATNGFDIGKATNGQMSSPQIIDIYKLDGTALWRLYMGYSSPSSQHTDNFMVYDLDQDGKSELSILTQDGTRTYKPDEHGKFKYVTTDQGGYVFKPNNPNNSESAGQYVLSEDGAGYVLSNATGYDFAYVGNYGSPMMDNDYLVDTVGDINLEGVNMRSDGLKSPDVKEYFTVFDGETGKVIDTIDYKFTTAYMLQTENYNLTNRFNIAIAYIPADLKNPNSTETIPAVLLERGYYAKATVGAYTLVDGKIKLAWDIDTVDAVKGGGNHNMVTGDIDNDGFDELYIGGTSIDHDGTILWAKDGEYNRDFMKHGDMIHMTSVFPDSDQLYVLTPVEDGSVSTVLNYALTNGSTGARILGHTFGKADTEKAMLANVTPDPGYELWASTPSGIIDGRISDVLFNAYGEVVVDKNGVTLKRPSVQTWNGYWDGDLLSELPDSDPIGGPDKSGFPMGIHKYNWETGETETIASFSGTLTNNSTKNNPSLMADILGDWREEILVRSTDNEELRIYMTNIPTDYTIYTLMHDPVYRNAIANQNTSYNQPAHTSFYLGEDEASKAKVLNFGLPTYHYTYTAEMNESTTPSTPDNSDNPGNPTTPQPSNNDPVVQPEPKGETVIKDKYKQDSKRSGSLTKEMLTKALKESPDGKVWIKSTGISFMLDGKWVDNLNFNNDLVLTVNPETITALPTLFRTQAERIGAVQVYSIQLVADKQAIEFIEGSNATVALPYEPKTRTNQHQIVVYELKEDGSLIPVTLSRYDAEKGQLIFRPTNLTSRYLVVESQVNFNDASGWSKDAIEALSARGIVNGKGEGTFDPKGKITRAELTAMLIRVLDSTVPLGQIPFKDVPDDAWYNADLAAAYALGLVNGRPDGTFGGNDYITREELSVLLYRAAKMLDILQTSNGDNGDTLSDESEISSFAIQAIRDLTKAGLINGLPNGVFAPKIIATREQASTMLWHLLQELNV